MTCGTNLMLLVTYDVRILQKSYVGVLRIISLHYHPRQSGCYMSTMQDGPLLLLAQNNQTSKQTIATKYKKVANLNSHKYNITLLGQQQTK